MIKNWKITCYLKSPLAGDPPFIDSLLEYELALRLGMKYSRKLTRDILLSEIEKPPIPLAQRTTDGVDVYCSSDPILSSVVAEWTDRQSKRFDSDFIALMLDDSRRKALLTASGPYKMRYAPMRVRLVDSVTWFVRGDKKEINKLLKKIIALGKHRNIGYGMIDRWVYEEIEKDNSIYAEFNGQKILMKTLPIGKHLDGVKGFFKSFGGGCPPYWHPGTYTEIAKPC